MGAADETRVSARLRRDFARATMVRAGVDNPRLEDGFAEIRREAFLRPPPWLVHGERGAEWTSDPSRLYDDVLVALDRDRGVNTGSPALHAAWIAALRPEPGERVVHIGAGTGYYTALLARLVGPSGRVTAIEVDRDLAAFAARVLPEVLPDGPPVVVVADDGETWPRSEADVVYVSFGIAAPSSLWLDRLAIGGRLLFPLCLPRHAVSPHRAWHGAEGFGLLVTRHEQGYAARALDACSFVYAEGPIRATRQDLDGLEAAFRHGGWREVRSLRRDAVDPARCWYAGKGWALCYDPPAERVGSRR